LRLHLGEPAVSQVLMMFAPVERVNGSAKR